ncbi:MAG: hypothetical protein ACD_59C00110G0015 [uncultured bacterium]|jgi:hypothetical protein|nr:MAG: hypothetical protein ACD_59C00110G0015 [uncultured bacterium]
MIRKLILKLKKYFISVVALAILAIFLFIDFFNQKTVSEDKKRDDEDIYFKYLSDGYFHEPMACKYGGPREPFLSQLLRIQNIRGVVRRKEDHKPVQGMALKVRKPEINVLSDENGEFEFEIFNIVYDTFEIEVSDPAFADRVLQVKTVEFIPEKKRGFYDRGFFKDEATIEILL